MHHKHEVAGSKPAVHPKNGRGAVGARVKNENSKHKSKRIGHSVRTLPHNPTDGGLRPSFANLFFNK